MCSLLKINMTNTAEEWVGCGECDPIFTCHKGNSPCIRLPRKENLKQFSDTVIEEHEKQKRRSSIILDYKDTGEQA